MSQQSFSTPRPVRLEVTVASGDIQIATVDGDQSTVTLDGSPKLLAATEVELLGDRLVIRQRGKAFGGFRGRFNETLHVQAEVPHRSGVQIVSAAGQAKLDGRFAAFEMKTASGDAVLTGDVEGDSVAKSVSGHVRLPHVGGDLTVNTVSGDVAADSVDGNVTVKSVSGGVRVASLREGNVNVQSVSGTVELGVAPGTNLHVDAGSASGRLISEVPLSDSPGEGDGPLLTIRTNTVNGDFRLFRAAA
jgi:hypothetical protein